MNYSNIIRRQILNVIILFLIGICFSFSYSNKHNYPPDSKIIIDIQPFSDISATEKEYVFAELKIIYPHIELKTAINLPKMAYYPKRNRYRADSLINFLDQQT